MAFPLDDILAGVGDPDAAHPATFGPRKRTDGIIFHTTESSGPSRESAVGTAEWQKSNPGSYNWIIYDGGLLLTVPYLEASGGVTSARTNPPWAPEAWLKDYLSPEAIYDPNAYLLNVAFSGRAADLAAGKYPANMIDTAAKLVLWVEAQEWGADNIICCGHEDFQLDRSDPGAGVVERILARYAELKAPAPVDYKALYTEAAAKVETQAAIIAELKEVVSRKNHALQRIATKAGELGESIDFAKNIA